MFQKLFSFGKGGSNDKQFIATISTLNILQKEPGYQSQQALMDAKVFFNFQKFDKLQEELRKMKEFNKEIKSKSRYSDWWLEQNVVSPFKIHYYLCF